MVNNSPAALAAPCVPIRFLRVPDGDIIAMEVLASVASQTKVVGKRAISFVPVAKLLDGSHIAAEVPVRDVAGIMQLAAQKFAAKQQRATPPPAT